VQEERKSLPSLLMVSPGLGALVQRRFSRDEDARAYLDHLRELATPSAA